MSIKIRIWKPKYYYGDAINGRPRAVEFFPGYTTLIGPNGSGKTTYLRQIQEFCRKHEYECLYFGATDDTDRYGKSNALLTGNISYLSGLICSSEGERIMQRTGALANRAGSWYKEIKAKNYKGPTFILIDSIDSGMSLDKLYVFRRDFVNFIIEFQKQQGNSELYIICAVNDWELIHDSRQLNVCTNRYMSIKTYESFRNFVFRNSKEELEDGEWKKKHSPKTEAVESCCSTITIRESDKNRS